ncbi:MAG: hypothetical protein WD335_02555 [Candidatus Paceibacterota bacterium]
MVKSKAVFKKTSTTTQKDPQHGEFYVSIVRSKDGRRTILRNISSKQSALKIANEKERGEEDVHAHAYQYINGKYKKIFPKS